MEKLASFLVARLISKQTIEEEKGIIYQYGLQIGLEVMLNTFISIIIAVLCRMEMEALIFFMVFIPLRSYAGGLHLEKYISCLLCSCLSLLGILLIVKYVSIDRSISVIIAIVSLAVIKFLAPVEDVNRLLDEAELTEFGKKLNITMIYILFGIFLCCLFNQEKLLFMIAITTLFMVCILLIGKIKMKNTGE